MKLIYCKSCEDIVPLKVSAAHAFQGVEVFVECKCGKSKAATFDGKEARYCGDAVPIHINNESFNRAIERQQPNMTASFKACVDPKKSHTFKKVERL